MGMGGGSGLLNELLMQMDPPPTDQGWKVRMLRKFGLRTKKAEMPAVFTMGATNLVETLDPALLRPGRFDWKITVERPSYEGRMEVLEYYLAKVKTAPNLPMERIATEMITPEGMGYSPVEVKFVVNEAVVHAHFDGREAITYEDMRHAMETREYGLRQRISGRTFEDKRRVAYHEAGHAIAMLRLYTRKRLDRLTLMQYGELKGAEGVAFDKAKEEIHITTKEELLVDIQIYLASKAAEIVFLGTETTGMGGDLPGASYRAVQYVRCGMGGQLFTMWGEMPTPEERRQAERVMQQQFSAARRAGGGEQAPGPRDRRGAAGERGAARRRSRGDRGARSTARSGAPAAGWSICRHRSRRPCRRLRSRLPRRASATPAPAAPLRSASANGSGPATTAWRTVR